MTLSPHGLRRKRHHVCEQGFSFIELVVVLVLMGILAAIALPRLSGGGFDERGFRDEVIAALRYAQKSAIAARRTVCASFSLAPSSVSFQLSAQGAVNCSVSATLAGPDGNPLVVTSKNTAAFAALPATIIFDSAGRPLSGAASISVGTLSLSIQAETGYVR